MNLVWGLESSFRGIYIPWSAVLFPFSSHVSSVNCSLALLNCVSSHTSLHCTIWCHQGTLCCQRQRLLWEFYSWNIWKSDGFVIVHGVVVPLTDWSRHSYFKEMLGTTPWVRNGQVCVDYEWLDSSNWICIKLPKIHQTPNQETRSQVNRNKTQ